MKATYIDHSGFLVESDTACFLFDWYQGELPERILKRSGKKPLYVFVSHSHSDHYTPKIFDLNADVYILADQIRLMVTGEARRKHRVIFMKPHQGLAILCSSLEDDPAPIQVLSGKTFHSLEELQDSLRPAGSDWQEYSGVYTLASNDLGVGFSVSTPEGCIYHAGDLNNWWWDGDAEDQESAAFYNRELARIEGAHFKIAMVPYDLRLKEPGYGIRDFLGHCSADILCPMHVNAERSRARIAFENDPVIRAACGKETVLF